LEAINLFTWVRCLVVTIVLVIVENAHAGEVKPIWKDHPYLFIERSDVPTIWQKAKVCDWARKSLIRIRKSADEWLHKNVEFPTTTGRHPWVYVCPDCNEALQTLSETQHQCPKCKKIYTGLPYDAVLLRSKHMALARAASNLGLAAVLFDRPEYAEKALNILLGYAERYSSYPLLDVGGGQGASAARIMDQTLNEAIWLIDIVWAYDLILGVGVGTEAEYRKIENQLIRPSIATISKCKAGKSNWQSWHNGALACAAIVLKDEKLLNEVLNDPSNGFFFQMKNSVTADGVWYEGSWTYHFYALQPLLKTTEACFRCGINLYRECPQLKKLLEAPLQQLMPDGMLPALHDSTPTSLAYELYEVGAARYGDPIFEDVLTRSDRSSIEALILGVPNPKPAPMSLKSIVLKDAGLAVLRRGGQYLCLDFGPHGGGHGHLDKLAVNYFVAGQVFAPDLGRGWPYNLPIHGQWYRQTLSHNTVVVDGEPQKECSGSLEWYEFRQECDAVCALAESCYEGVRMKRTLLMGEDWLLDVFEVESDKEHVYDWVWHGRGEFSSKLPVQPTMLKASHVSYKYLSNLRKGDGSSDWRAEWRMPGGTVYGLFKGSPGRQVFLCNAPDNPRDKTLSSVLLREKASKAVFTALFSTRPMEWSDIAQVMTKIPRVSKQALH
jgi:hypothetical protein